MNQNNNAKGPTKKQKRTSFLLKICCLLSVYCLSFLLLLLKIDLQEETKLSSNKKLYYIQPKKQPILTAYLETINQDEWEIKPLPPRKNAHSTKLRQIQYPGLTSCQNLPSQLPVDDYPEEDPFLPWIHDVFPSNDGKYITFIAQNKRRCHVGKEYETWKEHMQPQLSLFQHIPIQRINLNNQTRYKLTTHEEADEDAVETRFICKFKPSNQETLSIYHAGINYDHVTKHKRGGHTELFNRNGRDYNNLWNSQLVFHCPVHKDLVGVVRSGESVVRDYATLFVDLVPIR